MCNGHIPLSPSIFHDNKDFGDHSVHIQCNSYTTVNVKSRTPFYYWGVYTHQATTCFLYQVCMKNSDRRDKLWVLFPKMLILSKPIRESSTTVSGRKNWKFLSAAVLTYYQSFVSVCEGDEWEISRSCGDGVCVCVCVAGGGLQWWADESIGVYRDGPWSCCPAHASIVQ